MGAEYAYAAWAIPYIGAALVLALYRTSRKIRETIAVGALFASAIFSTLTFLAVVEGETPLHYSIKWVESLDVTLGVYVDGLSATMSLVVAWLSFLIGFYSIKYMEHDPDITRYWFFFDFFVGSMQLLVLADNLLLMFIGWEGTGLASYSLIGFWYKDEEEKWVGDPGRTALGIPMFFQPSHSGVRAIVFTRLGDVGLLAGIGLIYALTGTLLIPEVAEKMPHVFAPLGARGLLYLFLLIFSLGALAKSAQFPFHEWLVTAMTGPTSVSALIHAATMVKAGVFFMLRFAPMFYETFHKTGIGHEAVTQYFYTIALIGGFTAFFMATQALVSRELKLILAFSTASQLGYMFLAIGSAGLLKEFVLGFVASFSHLMGHAFFKATLFLAAGAIIHAVESRFIDDMGGLLKYMKYTFMAMFLAVLSLSGVPPLLGFWSKDAVLEAAYESHYQILYLLGLITAGLTAFYSLRMVFRVFDWELSKHVKHLIHEGHLHEAHPIMLSPYFFLAILTLGMGLLWPNVFPEYAEILTKGVPGIEKVEFHAPHINIELTLQSLGLVAFGYLTAYILYGRKLDYKLLELLNTKKWAKAIHDILYDRWYLNSVYYLVFVKGGLMFARTLHDTLNLFVDSLYHKFLPALFSSGSKFFSKTLEIAVDKGYNVAVPSIFTSASSSLFKILEQKVIDSGFNVKLMESILESGRALRKTQIGRINYYLAFFFAFLVVLAVVVFWVI